MTEGIETQYTVASLSRRGKGFLTACASLEIPGLGQLIAGRPRRAAAWFAAHALLALVAVKSFITPGWLPVAGVCFLILVAVNLAAIADAYLCGRGSSRPMLGRPFWRYLARIVIVVAGAVINPAYHAALYVRRHYVHAYMMPTHSMEPAITAGDRILSNKTVPYGRWSIVAFRPPISPSTTFVKRVVGLPGETIELDQGGVRVNGQLMTPPPGVGPYTSLDYTGRRIRPGHGCAGNPIMLGKDEYYLLGDNSPISGDCRYWNDPVEGHQPGAIPADSILGTVTDIYWPPSRWRHFR